MAGCEWSVACDEQGNIDLPDLRRRSTSTPMRLAAVMVTYPSTTGCFEEGDRTGSASWCTRPAARSMWTART